MAAEHFDVVVVGAGLSGISAACHLQRLCPDRSFAILEGRQAMGGTWDLFRYPGIRSDSDMHTLGYAFRPWTGKRAIADGGSILEYVRDTAREAGVDRHIRFGHRVMAARWSTEDAAWHVEAQGPDGAVSLTCNFLHLCSGYYDYARGHTPDFAGADTFAGQIVHPQFWPQDLDWHGKRIVVIGSGATAVTLAPALAGAAAHVTMLQRSPTYVVSLPSADPFAARVRKALPMRLAQQMIRWRSILTQMLFYKIARTRPKQAKANIVAMAREHLGPDFDVETHFSPNYDPWDQRVCLIPDADLFTAIRSGRVSVVTDHIDRFTQDGIALKSGEMVPADIIVTATGLELNALGDIAVSVDGRAIDPTTLFAYRGLMFSDVPNFAYTLGYINASWTLKADLTSRYVCRLLNAMRRRGLRQVTPRIGSKPLQPQPFLRLSSGYITRSAAKLPHQGNRSPWRVHQNYLADLLPLRFGSLGKSAVFSNPVPPR